MRIGIIGLPFQKITSAAQGGIETIVYELTEELVRQGHDVTLFGAGHDTETSAKFIPVYDTPVNDMQLDPAATEASRKLRLEMTYSADVATRLLEMEPFDVVFSHTRGEAAMAPITRYYPAPII